ncbi:helix-turn-helix domain-containing protein [Stappia sp. F7233]|uniref:Helix-turn-helix domain-containing protein n=1 Tax=Stappia albiluteola TaxID=2758565 RepID=A0A839AHD8_9HYPH|nr:helix-turn-helix domain-containing protein [Stappia albiluteola]MBA5779131.1 helix-turn-helix domain-containing protein [Stappia albiluteola]
MAYLDRGLASNGGHGAGGAAFSAREAVPFSHIKTQRHHEHTVLFYEGDPADRLFELEDGVVMLYKLLPDGRRQVVEILNTGAVFGVPGHDVYDCSAESLTPIRVSSFDRREIETSATLQKQLTRCLMSQMETLHDHAVLLGRKSAVERVATFLMRLVPNRGGVGCLGPADGKPQDEFNVTLTMTRQEIADYLGLTIETVSRVISDLKRRGFIKIERQDHIRINNVCGMCQLTGAH